MTLRVGSPAHRDLLCRTFIDTHKPFEPQALPWPRLLQRFVDILRSFPFWGLALSMEQEAGRMITAVAQTIEDPLIREAIELQAYEEARHARLLAHMLERYEIDVPRVPPATTPVTLDDFITFGFGECFDSLIGFGGFALARKKQIFPRALLDIFEQILFEEARHIVFFINWWRYSEALAGRTNPVARVVRALEHHAQAIAHTAQGAQAEAGGAVSFDLTSGGSQTILEGVTPLSFLTVALAENRAMMARLDRRLLRPRIIPALGTAAILGLRMLPPRAPAAVPVASMVVA